MEGFKKVEGLGIVSLGKLYDVIVKNKKTGDEVMAFTSTLLKMRVKENENTHKLRSILFGNPDDYAMYMTGISHGLTIDLNYHDVFVREHIYDDSFNTSHVIYIV